VADPRLIDDAHFRRVLRDLVEPALEGPAHPLDEIAAHHVRGEPIPYGDAVERPFEPFAVGDRWGPSWDTTWFRLRGTVPGEWADEEVVLRFEIGRAGDTGFGAEALVWHDGRPVQGLSPNHREYRLTASATGGEQVELLVEAAANPRPPFGAAVWPELMPEPDGRPLFTLARADLQVVRRDLRAFWYDVRLLDQLLVELPYDDPRAQQVRRALALAVRSIDLDDVPGSVGLARPALKDALAAPARASAHRVSAVGHAHLDTAWLWPLRETVRKCARTFSTAVRLMDDYPEYRFACSQAVHLWWVKQHYPDLYERIREKVAAGQFEPTGSMWVEPDCNVPSGESLVRQFVYGKRFFLDEFGIETRDAWLPDVFGFTAALPQIMRRAGVDWFLTQKLSWNAYNDMPHHSFLWEGIDGSRVFSHFPPADTYGGNATVKELRDSERRFKDHDVASRSLYPFGHSDGGGGPTAEMLEALRRMRDLEGVPRVAVEGPRAFFELAAGESDDWPVWSGELYLELHRGTYTTHADTKLGNRRGEHALRAAELWATAVLPRDEYPGEVLEATWKTLLLHQFHDILPGSGIHWVYEDSRAAHAGVVETASGIVDRATEALAQQIDTSATARPVVVRNAASHDRSELLVYEGEVLGRVAVPACGYTVVDRAVPVTVPAVPVEVSRQRLENDRLRVELDDDGLLVSIFDKLVGREVLAAGERGNLFQLHEDHPNFFDAWDVDRFAFDSATELTALDGEEVLEPGGWRGSLRQMRSFGRSRITQTISLAAGSARLEFATEVDWHEDHRFLKVAFPVAVRSPRATYEIQFGHLERPTHENTSWELARFEVSAHQWADLSEGDYGVALLNDCKYGYDVRGNVLRLSLLRSPTWPDPVADRGRNRFTYALLPHQGDFRAGRVVEEARELNLPLEVVPATPHAGSRAPSDSFVRVDRPGVEIVAVKRADRADGVVVRLCELWGRRTPVRLTLWDVITAAARTDLLERDLEPLAPDRNGTLTLDLLPFELVTLRLELGP
jgi:alpha-mannosidase